MSLDRPNNHFLRALTASDFDLIRQHLVPAKFKSGTVLFESEEPIKLLYIPTSGIISLVVTLASGDGVEAAMIGHDGIVGTTAILNSPVSLNKGIVQLEGGGFTLDVEVVRQAIRFSETLRQRIYQYDQLILLQSQQSAACNVRHPLEERLCRWLLRSRDLAESESLPLTQEFMAQMLGVQRSTLSLTAHRLQMTGLINYRRGNVQVMNLEGMKDSACECYDTVKSHQERLCGYRAN